MNFQEVTEQARGNIGPYCKACNVCNGAACKNQMPGPGAKGLGKVAMRNYEKWQEICVNMDTICEQKPVNTKVELFGRTFDYPVFAGPVGAVNRRSTSFHCRSSGKRDENLSRWWNTQWHGCI